MRGSIIKRGKSSYTIVLNMGNDPITGKRKQQWVSVKGSKKEAEKKLAELLHQLDTGSFIQPGKTTLAEYLMRWLADYVKPNLSPRTTEGYEHIVTHYIIPSLGSHVLTRLKPEHLQQFYSIEMNTGLSAQTVRHHHMVIHKALDNAVEWGIVIRNVADAVRPPKAQRTEMHTWDEHELEQFLGAAESTPYYGLFYLALFTGMRRSELLALRWQDIDFIYSQISVSRGLHVLKGHKIVFSPPKTASGRRTVALSPSASLILSEYREKREAENLLLGKPINDGDLVFNTLGNPLLPNTITHAWQKLIKRTGLRAIRLHDARHTHASLMLKQGIHPKIVQERLGHSSIQITLDTYSHVTPGLQQAAAQRFDDLVKVVHNEKVQQNSVSKRLADSHIVK